MIAESAVPICRELSLPSVAYLYAAAIAAGTPLPAQIRLASISGPLPHFWTRFALGNHLRLMLNYVWSEITGSSETG